MDEEFKLRPGPWPVQGWLKQRPPATGRARASVDAGPDRLEPELENQMDEELDRKAQRDEH